MMICDNALYRIPTRGQCQLGRQWQAALYNPVARDICKSLSHLFRPMVMYESCLLTAMMIVAAGMFDVARGAVLDTAANGHLLDNMCSRETCKVGTTAITYATKTDPYYACPTRELTEYVNTILGFVEITAKMSGTLPKISDKTGEPEFADETQDIVKGLRIKAQVTTFDVSVRDNHSCGAW